MAATHSSRLKLTPSNSPHLVRPLRSPMRGRPMHDSRLSLSRVIGTTCCTPNGFDAVGSSFAYIAGGAVVVVDVVGDNTYTQRFYRARPAAIPVYSISNAGPSSSISNSTPKANDSRNRVAANFRDSSYSPIDWPDSPASRTWTSRERIKAATCLALSRDGKFLAVGETGYAPRVLIFGLQDNSSDTPLVSISEHSFGVNCVAWSHDTRYLASLGAANDGFLYVWRIDARTGSARLFQQNRCTSYIRDMVWIGNCLVTLGVRHIKMWRIEEPPTTSPTKARFLNDQGASATPQRTLPGRNVLLGSLLDATFTCAAVNDKRLLICTEAGDVCTLDEDDKQAKLVKVLNVGFPISSIAIRANVAYVSGSNGKFATLDVDGVMNGTELSQLTRNESLSGLVAMGFLVDKFVTIDSQQSIDVWSADYLPGKQAEAVAHIPISGHGEPILGTQAIEKPNQMAAEFLTWSGTGNVMFWDLQGQVKSSMNIPMELPLGDFNLEPPNQLTCAHASRDGSLLIAADQLGVLKVIDVQTKDILLDTKAHSSHCLSIALYESKDQLIIASCGRDRTAQLFHRPSGGSIEHFQTLEFAARVVQVLIPTEDKVLTCSLDRTLQIHDLVAKENDLDVLAAVPSKIISLRAAPTSMAVGPDKRSVFVSLLDRSVCHFDLSTGRQIGCYKCVDEYGVETAVLDSLSIASCSSRDTDFLLAASNTDKSIRLYDAQSGSFLDREWGHTEAIHGVSLVPDAHGNEKVVSVGSDGTIMIWMLDFLEHSPSQMSRDPSPAKDVTPSSRPTLRRVLSKAELAEFPRPQSSQAGRRSPPRTVRRRTSRYNLANSNSTMRTPTGNLHASPSSSTLMDDTPSRRPSGDARGSSPPPSPKSRLTKRPSLPTLGSSLRKKSSSSSMSGFGSLNAATEQTCRTLKAYRKKLSSAEPISADALTELDQELRLTAAALGDRAIRSKAMNETVLSGLLDQYSERLITLLDEKLRLTPHGRHKDSEATSVDAGEERPRSRDGDTVAPIHLVATRDGPLDRWRGGPRGMNHPATHTLLESLFLFQATLSQGVDPEAFARISGLLKDNAFIKADDSYDANRLGPDALQHLFLRLLYEEIRGDAERVDGGDGAASPGSRKRKLGSPPMPTLTEATSHLDKIPTLINRLWVRYRDHKVKEIQDEERRYVSLQKDIGVLERSESQRAEKLAKENAAASSAPRETKPSPLDHVRPISSSAPVHGSPGPAHKPPATVTPVLPPQHPVATTPPVPLKAAPAAHPPPAATPIRPSPSPQPASGPVSGLQAPVVAPPPPPAQRTGPSPAQPPRQAITPRPAEPVNRAKDGASSTPQQPSTPTPGALRWEKQYKPLQPGQTPPVGKSPSPALVKASVPPQKPPLQPPQQLVPPPAQASKLSPQPQTPQPRAPGKPAQVPLQNAGQLAPPLQPGPPRPSDTPAPPQARPTSNTPVLPPSRPIQSQQAAPQQPPQPPRPIASASSTVPGSTPSTNVAPPRRWTQTHVPPQGPHSQAASSSTPAPSPKDKAYTSPYIAQPSRPPIPEHIIRQAASTPISAKRLSSVAAPHTPMTTSPALMTSGLGTKWANQSTPSTPGPFTAGPDSPAFEPVSPPQRPVPAMRETPKTSLKKEKSVAKFVPRTDSSAVKPARGRPPRSAQKSRGESATPSVAADRRSQSVASQTDELSMDTPMVMARIKDEEATPRPHEETGDTTADESVPGRSHMVTPSSVSRLLKRKRQDTPTEIAQPPSHVLWTRGFTKVSSSALDQISSHRDANMFATALRERDAPGYRQIVLQPQDITSIRAAIKQGNKAAVQAAAALPGGDPGTASVWLPVSEELVPPKAIINSAQLERELVHMFCNAIMYNYDPERGPGTSFLKRSKEEEEEVVGYRLDENGVVKNTQGMFLEVEKLLGDLRSAEKERSAPPPSATRLTSVATPAEDTQDDEDELAGEPDSATGTVKRRRTTHRA
ncbi:hypothetical protein S40288_03196 [Stachybotrys chartarum IBT 40288]|nr:hypothetical protein S40288_03196 [Stachybotrys chartarum IBT 40288]